MKWTQNNKFVTSKNNRSITSLKGHVNISHLSQMLISYDANVNNKACKGDMEVLLVSILLLLISKPQMIDYL